MPREQNIPSSPVDWYVVPWGAAKDNPSNFKFSLRAMPQDATALADWPAYLARMGETSVVLRPDGGQTSQKPIFPAEHYRAYLEKRQLSLEQASSLWRAVFGDLPSPASAAPNVCASAVVNRNEPVPEMAHCTASLAKQTQMRIASIVADSMFAQYKRRENRMAAANQVAGAALSGLVAPTSPSEPTQAWLHGAAALYAPVQAPLPLNTVRLTAGDRWSIAALSAKVETKSTTPGLTQPEPHVPYSRTHIEYLLGGANFRARTSFPPVAGEEHGLDDFAMLLAARRRTYASASANSQEAALKAEASTIEEYQARCSALCLHPWLAKALGLTIGIELKWDDAMQGLATIALTGAAWPAATAVSPICDPKWTAMEKGFPRSVNAPADNPNRPTYRAGLLNVSEGNDTFLLTQLDVDRTPEKYVQSAVSYASALASGRELGKLTVSLQPQETVGLSLIEHVTRRKQTVLAPPRTPVNGETVLYLENLLAGYRPDARRLPGGRWHSLTARRIRRVLLGQEKRDVTHWFRAYGTCEAFIPERTRAAREDDGSKINLFGEGELFRWSGHPFASPDAPPSKQTGHLALDKVGGTNIEGLHIEYEPFDVLPQRFGEQVEFGVRLAMVDGNSIDILSAGKAYTPPTGDPPPTAEPVLTIGSAPLLRFESLAPPTVLLEHPLDLARFPNETARRVIVASSASAFVSRRATVRVLVPPRAASQDLCLRHGVFESMRHARTWPASAFAGVELTPEGDFPATGATDTTRQQFFRPAAPDALPPRIPYYPDPWAKRAIIAIYRKGDDRLMDCLTWEFQDDLVKWPDVRVLRLRVVAENIANRDTGFRVQNEKDGFTIFIAPGLELVLRVWHEVTDDMLAMAGIEDQLRLFADDATEDVPLRGLVKQLSAKAKGKQSLIATLSEGELAEARKANIDLPCLSYWMLNPFEEIELVHAVDKPVWPVVPEDDSHPLEIRRNAGQTRATFAGFLYLDRHSTISLRVTASWQDIPERAAPDKHARYGRTPTMRHEQLFDIQKVAIIAGDEWGSPPRAPMAEKLPIFQGYQRLDAEVAVRASDHYDKAPVTGDFDFHDTRARVIDVVTCGDSRYAHDFAPELELDTRRSSQPVPVIVEGTARPDPPRIDYVVPLLAWDESMVHANDSQRTREAGWFRIWLDDSWYNSGNGELLALVCWPGPLLPTKANSLLALVGMAVAASDATPNPVIEPFVTRWGLDPTAAQDIEFGNLPIAGFLNRLRSLKDVESTGGPAAVLHIDMQHLHELATFEPRINLGLLKEFQQPAQATGAPPAAAMEAVLALYRPLQDDRTGRMFVDVQIDPGYAYQPLVRLALARFQALGRHNHKEDLRLSTIVPAEFVQLMPKRTATVRSVYEQGHVVAVHVTVAGTALRHVEDGTAALHTRFVASVEQRELGLVPDNGEINGAWAPVSNKAEDVPLQPDETGSVWRAVLPFGSRVSHEYSVRIEEYEYLVDEKTKAKTDYRLVYFDRIPLRYI